MQSPCNMVRLFTHTVQTNFIFDKTVSIRDTTIKLLYKEELSTSNREVLLNSQLHFSNLIFKSSDITYFKNSNFNIILFLLGIGYGTCSGPIFPLNSHYLVYINNHLFTVVIGPILNKNIKIVFRSDRSDFTCVYT